MTINELEEKCVFRYRAMNKNTMKEVLNTEIWHSTIDNLNDPFEFPIHLDWSELKKSDASTLTKYAQHFSILSNDEITYYIINNQLDKIRNIIIDNLEKLQMSLPEYYSGLFVACFSGNMKSPLMWSHYSDGMKGLCIAYNRNHLESSELFKLFPIEYNQNPIKFNYSDLTMIPVMNEFKYYDYEKNEESVGKGSLVRLTSYKYLYQKHERWGYEEEMRNIIDPNSKRSNPKNGGLIAYPKGAVSAVIVGSKMKKTHKKMVVSYCAKNGIPVYVASPNLSDYTVKIQAL
jgi:hypothetical protein